MRILKKLPLMTLALIAANIAVFAVQPGLNPTPGSPADHFLRLIWPEPLDILERSLSGDLISTLLVIPGLVMPVFMHANFEHIAGNMVGLLIFGSLLEWRVGWKTALKVYAAAGLGGQVLTVLLDIRALGASGAISGVMGAYLGIVAWPPTIWSTLRQGKVLRALIRASIALITYQLVRGLWTQVLSGKPSAEMTVDGQTFGVGDIVHLLGLLIGLGMITVYQIRNWRQERRARSEQLISKVDGNPQPLLNAAEEVPADKGGNEDVNPTQSN